MAEEKVEQKEKEMSFLDHLEVLRWHIIRACVAIIVSAVSFFSLGKVVFQNLIFGPKNPNFISYRIFCAISEATCLKSPSLELIRKELGEEFFVHIKVSIFLGIAFAMPYIFWEIWRFIRPGLYDKERKSAKGFVLVCSALFMFGISFGYFIIAPFAISYLSNYSVADMAVQSTSTLSSYVSYLTMFTFPCGILFQLPVVVFFLTKIGVISPQFMKKYRRHGYVLLLILSAIITPPDVISQILICIPLYGLYELSIFVSKFVYNKEQKQTEHESTIS